MGRQTWAMADVVGANLKKLDLTIARLRLLVAEVRARESASRAQRDTFLAQRDKLITFAMYGDPRYGDTSMDSVVAMLSEVDDRISDSEKASRVLSLLRERIERELESLQLTKGVEEARLQLTALVAQQAEGGDASPLTPEEIRGEIARLQLLINEASERAARSIEAGRRG
jgi:ribosomal protein L29